MARVMATLNRLGLLKKPTLDATSRSPAMLSAAAHTHNTECHCCTNHHAIDEDSLSHCLKLSADVCAPYFEHGYAVAILHFTNHIRIWQHTPIEKTMAT